MSASDAGEPSLGSSISATAALFADATRAGVCDALMDGCAWTPGELRQAAGVSAPAMSACLDRLETAGAVRSVRQGRHRYVMLAGDHVASVVEFLGNVSGEPPAKPIGYRQVQADQRLRTARTCYSHIAGGLGVAIAETMVKRSLLIAADESFSLSGEGESWFRSNGILQGRTLRAPHVRACLDWTQRRMHLAGSYGTALCSYLISTGALRRTQPRRALAVTEAGKEWLRNQLGLDIGTAAVIRHW
jgi:DNA-binding transcriptional ArsR family regulator